MPSELSIPPDAMHRCAVPMLLIDIQGIEVTQQRVVVAKLNFRAEPRGLVAMVAARLRKGFSPHVLEAAVGFENHRVVNLLGGEGFKVYAPQRLGEQTTQPRAGAHGLGLSKQGQSNAIRVRQRAAIS